MSSDFTSLPPVPADGISCPIPLTDYPAVLLAHGGGGRLMHHLLEKMFLPEFGNPALAAQHDGALLDAGGVRLAFTTDSFVVHPPFFPGGDIGSLAVYGTVNDLAMCGARPRWLSAAFLLEEGLPMEDLWRVVRSMRQAADRCGVALVTGDTKVVDRGKGDKIFITTSGIGLVPAGVDLAPARVVPGDAVILSGAVGLHGIAVMSVREGIAFETGLKSDAAPLDGLVAAMLGAHPGIHVLRDPTRGGVATTLNEIAQASGTGIAVEEELIPVPGEVEGACEILGLDPLYVANEGKLLACVPPPAVSRVLAAMRAHPLGTEAAVIGTVVPDHPGTVVVKNAVGGRRILDMLSGEQLPRIC